MGGLFEPVEPGVVAAGESVGERFFEADLLFAGLSVGWPVSFLAILAP